MKTISVKGARTHNLKNIDIEIPRNKLVVITGLSGSGKSSLAFDTLYAEGQRRYVESLSAYARQFLSLMEKPDVDHIEGLSPAISIEQKSTNHNPRSTVGTITEIADYLRLLFARVGTPYCPDHHQPLQAQTISQMVDQVLALETDSRLMILAPVIQDKKGEHQHILSSLAGQGFVRIRLDGVVTDLDDLPDLDKNKKHRIEVVVDRFRIRQDINIRLADSFETAVRVAGGTAYLSFIDEPGRQEIQFSANYACPQCGHSVAELEPRLFSFNNPIGACRDCEGLGIKQVFDPSTLIRDPDLSISEGAISGWDRRHIYYYQLLENLSDHCGFDLTTAFKTISEENKDIIFYGSGENNIPFQYTNEKGLSIISNHPFEGIINNLERRFRETESSNVRDNLARMLTLKPCGACQGQRLNRTARSVLVNDMSYSDISGLSIQDALDCFNELKLTGQKGEISQKILKEIRARLGFLVDVGLNYLTLARSADTLSGGEAQRIRLASQIGAGLVGVMYILDEPSIGLHQRDNQRLLNTLTRLRDMGNSVLIVEHDESAIKEADYLIDMGPGAGVHGGQVVASGALEDIISVDASITGQFLSRKRVIAIPQCRVSPNTSQFLHLSRCSGNNLATVDLRLPLGLLTCVTGVSGSGKSTLINQTLYPLAATFLNGASTLEPSPYEQIAGLELLDKVVAIDQSPIGRTPRSNPATYTNIFTSIRDLFAATQEARSRGYKAGRFSFNVKGGRCEACQGDGLIKVEMHFLPDIYVLCDECKGKRYNRETLEIRYKGRAIDEILNMTVEQALSFLKAVPVIQRRLQTLVEVGLSYIKLGQSATTLSGGEAQRVKLARELAKRDTGKTLYILDEPTTGLHFHDIDQLLSVIHQLRDRGNTVVIIEHNLDVIKTADWIIDLGPEGGAGGGHIIAEGTPETVSGLSHSFTGQYLKKVLFENTLSEEHLNIVQS
ncbi:MAG TPA: excinuclease ABC subunit UvrA [Gammaproteobacteria bacterium]|nr:excinuclease ABC subunit UvrA [Gammaproteobacteria bacterium]HIK71005.1 excinuclease ABC subunit UvrA [Pseudomonadales bacterium]